MAFNMLTAIFNVLIMKQIAILPIKGIVALLVIQMIFQYNY